jgi:hypothetical protein
VAKPTPLEEELYNAWEKVAFEGGGFAGKPLPREELNAQEQRHLVEWEKLLSRAHDGTQWIVGSQLACTLSRSHWFSLMILREYARAEQTITDCLTHPEPCSRHESADLPARMLTARLALNEREAARELDRYLDCGIYSKGRMAFLILYAGILSLAEDQPPEKPISPELSSLAARLARELRRRKQLIARCEGAGNWGELASVLSEVASPQ